MNSAEENVDTSASGGRSAIVERTITVDTERLTRTWYPVAGSATCAPGTGFGADTRVLLDNQPAAVLSVTDGEICFQLPWAAAPGHHVLNIDAPAGSPFEPATSGVTSRGCGGSASKASATLLPPSWKPRRRRCASIEDFASSTRERVDGDARNRRRPRFIRAPLAGRWRPTPMDVRHRAWTW